MHELNRAGALVAASLLIWVSVALVEVLAGSGLITGIAVLAAFGSTLALWLVWGLSLVDETAESREKAKRSTGDDTRLALLLELLNDDERHALKERLLDDLSADGEALPLASLLEAQDDHQHDHHGQA